MQVLVSPSLHTFIALSALFASTVAPGTAASSLNNLLAAAAPCAWGSHAQAYACWVWPQFSSEQFAARSIAPCVAATFDACYLSLRPPGQPWRQTNLVLKSSTQHCHSLGEEAAAVLMGLRSSRSSVLPTVLPMMHHACSSLHCHRLHYPCSHSGVPTGCCRQARVARLRHCSALCTAVLHAHGITAMPYAACQVG